MPEDDVLKDMFNSCALAAGFMAHAEGRLADSEYVRQLAYSLYEENLKAKNARAP